MVPQTVSRAPTIQLVRGVQMDTTLEGTARVQVKHLLREKIQRLLRE